MWSLISGLQVYPLDSPMSLLTWPIRSNQHITLIPIIGQCSTTSTSTSFFKCSSKVRLFSWDNHSDFTARHTNRIGSQVQHNITYILMKHELNSLLTVSSKPKTREPRLVKIASVRQTTTSNTLGRQCAFTRRGVGFCGGVRIRSNTGNVVVRIIFKGGSLLMNEWVG